MDVQIKHNVVVIWDFYEISINQISYIISHNLHVLYDSKTMISGDIRSVIFIYSIMQQFWIGGRPTYANFHMVHGRWIMAIKLESRMIISFLTVDLDLTSVSASWIWKTYKIFLIYNWFMSFHKNAILCFLLIRIEHFPANILTKIIFTFATHLNRLLK